jgi:hypothetical protein
VAQQRQNRVLFLTVSKVIRHLILTVQAHAAV